MKQQNSPKLNFLKKKIQEGRPYPFVMVPNNCQVKVSLASSCGTVLALNHGSYVNRVAGICDPSH